MRTKIWIFLIIFSLLMAACNLPTNSNSTTAESSETPNVDIIGTAVQLTTAAKMTELADTVTVSVTETPPSTLTETPGPTSSPTPCTPIVTATTTANVRSGPDTAYGVVGSLANGATANIAGRNDANTWWYIELSGGHAWVSGSVVTASCLPATLQIVAAPPLPTATVTPEPTGAPDLVATGIQYWPSPAKKGKPVSIQVRVTNSGDAPAGEFTVVWLSNQDKPGCSWTVPAGLGVGESKDLECEFTYGGNATATYWVTLIVDSKDQVEESNEDNNSRDDKLYVKP